MIRYEGHVIICKSAQDISFLIKHSPIRLSSASLTTVEPNDIVKTEHLFFNRLYVHEQERKNGNGTTLMNAVENHSITNKIPILNTPNYYGEGDGEWYIEWLKRREWKQIEIEGELVNAFVYGEHNA